MSENSNAKLWRTTVLVFVIFLLLAAGGAVLLANRARTGPRVAYERGVILVRSGEPERALASFDAALEMTPEFKEAQLGKFRAYMAMREFRLAEGAVAKAEEMGLGEADAALLYAEIALTEANYKVWTWRSAAEGDEEAKGLAPARLYVSFCKAVVEEDLAPVVSRLNEIAALLGPEGKEAGHIHAAAGDLLMQGSRTLSLAWRRLNQAKEEAARLERADEVRELENLLRDTVAQMVQSQTAAIEAFTRASEADPTLVQPQLEIAGHYLGMYVPRPAQAKEALQPVLEAQPDNRRAHELMALAERLEGNMDKALEHVHAMRQLDEEDASALLAEVAILVEGERWDEALVASATLMELEPSGSAAAYYRGRVLLHHGHIDEARLHLQAALARVRSPWPEGRHYLAEALRLSGRREQAIRTYQQAIRDSAETVPTDIRLVGRVREARLKSYSALSRMLADTDPELSALLAQQALETQPASVEAYDHAMATARAAGAEPNTLESLILIHAYGLLTARNPGRALALCRREIEAAENLNHVWQVGLLKARLLAQLGAFSEAVEAYERIRGVREDKRPLYELAELHLRLNRHEEAQALYEELLRADPRDMRATRGIVALMEGEGGTEAIREILAHSAAQLGAGESQVMLLRHYIRSGMTREALALARAVSTVEPRNPVGHYLLAEAMWFAGRKVQARVAFDRALELSPTYSPGYRRGLLDLQMGKVAEAVALYQKAREELPDALAPKIHLAVALQAAGQAEKAIELLNQTAEEGGVPAGESRDALRWYLAVMLAGAGRQDDALAQNEDIVLLAFGPKEHRERFLTRLASAPEPDRQRIANNVNLLIAFTRGACVEAALEQAESLKQSLPGETLPAVWTSALLEGQGRHEDALTELHRLSEEEPGFVFAKLRMAETYAKQGDIQSATRVLEDILGHVEEHQAHAVHFLLGQLHEQASRFDHAIAHYEAATKGGRAAGLAMNNLAWILATQGGDLQRALELAEKAVEEVGPRPEILDTLGWVHYLSGNGELAVRYLLLAKNGMPHVASIRYHLGMAFLKTGRTEEGKKELREALSISPDFPEAEEAIKALEQL